MGNQNVKYIGFKDVKFIVIGVVALGFLIPRIFFGLNSNVSSLVLSAHWFEAAIFSATYWLTARSIMIYFRKQFPLFRDSIKRIIYTVIGSLLVTSVLCVILDKSLTFCLANMVDFSQHKPTLGQALTATELYCRE